MAAHKTQQVLRSARGETLGRISSRLFPNSTIIRTKAVELLLSILEGPLQREEAASRMSAVVSGPDWGTRLR